MERGIAMMTRLHILSLLFLLMCLSTSSATARRTLVLAADAGSMLPPLTIQETRKLFLGVPLEKSGTRVIPLLNTSDPLTYEVFLQKVAFMSASAYETQMISIVFRLGGKRPETYTNLQQLVADLRQTPGAVTYLWEDQVQAQGLKAVSVLWQEVGK